MILSFLLRNDRRPWANILGDPLPCGDGEPFMSGDRRLEFFDDDDHFYDDDDDDDETESMKESERVIHEFFVSHTMAQWARHGVTMPKNFINPFEIYD